MTIPKNNSFSFKRDQVDKKIDIEKNTEDPKIGRTQADAFIHSLDRCILQRVGSSRAEDARTHIITYFLRCDRYKMTMSEIFDSLLDPCRRHVIDHASTSNLHHDNTLESLSVIDVYVHQTR